MERDDLFFVNRAKDFEIDKMKLHPSWRNDWNRICEMATNKPDRYKSSIEMLLDIIGFRESIRLLDVGCSVGWRIIELANIGAECVGLDAAEDAIRLLNQVRDEFGLNVRGIYGDACNLPLNDESFDVVMSTQFFEHVADIDLAITEQIRVLRGGGKLIIEQANFLSPFVLIDLLVKYPRRTNGKYGGIKWLYTKGKVRENLYGDGCTQKDEDVHSRLWWRMKMRQYSNLEVEEFTSYTVKRRGSFYKILEPFIGNILIIARKRSR